MAEANDVGHIDSGSDFSGPRTQPGYRDLSGQIAGYTPPVDNLVATPRGAFADWSDFDRAGMSTQDVWNATPDGMFHQPDFGPAHSADSDDTGGAYAAPYGLPSQSLGQAFEPLAPEEV